MTSSELGRVTYTSQSAVVRLYQKIGIDNYKTFYSILIEEIAIRKNMQDIDFDYPIKKGINSQEIINTIANYYIQEIINTKLSINKNAIQRLYNHMKAAESIDVYAVGRDMAIVA